MSIFDMERIDAWWPNFDKKATLNGKYVQYLLHRPRRPQASTMSSDTIPGDSEEKGHSCLMMQDLSFNGKEFERTKMDMFSCLVH